MATFCVGPAATGTGSGVDWNNLKAWTDTPVRGDSWYLIDGTYVGKTFSVAISGTTLITIKKASVLDHGGIETGWLNSLGNGFAQFNGQIQFTTSFWVFDGAVGGDPTAHTFNGWTSGYGYKCVQNTNIPVIWFNGCGDITFQHAEIKGLLTAEGGLGNDGIRCAKADLTSSGSGTISVNNCYIHDCGRSLIYHRDGPMDFSYCFLGTYQSTVGEPCAAVELHSSALLRFRFGVVSHVEGLGGFLSINNVPANGNTTANIYGNVFFNSGSTTWVTGGQGFIAAVAADSFMLNWTVYENTFINFPAALEAFGDSGESASGCDATDNFFYGTLLHAVDTGWTQSYDHFQDSGAASGTNGTTGTGDPFTDYINYDFSLLAETTAGRTLVAPYGKDMMGATRGSDGVWTRGAIEFTSGSTPVGVRELYATTDTGVALYWNVHEPVTPGPWPVALFFHAGGFVHGGNDNSTVTNSLADAGFLALGAEYRLAPPHLEMNVAEGGHESPGQDTVGDDGHWPKQTNDVGLAIRTARADPRCNGIVYALGGSAGAGHSAFLAATGTPGDDMPDLAVILSCGLSNFADPNMWALVASPGETDPAGATATYLNIPNTRPLPPTGADLVTAQDASAVNHLHPNMPPMFILCYGKDSLGIPTSSGYSIHSYNRDETIGPLENGSNGLIPRLIAAGYEETTSSVPQLGKFRQTVMPTAAHTHAFEGWRLPYDGVVGHATLQDVVIAWLLGGVPIPGGGTQLPILKGASVLISPEVPIEATTLQDTNVDGVAIGVRWKNFEPSEGTYDYTYFDAEIRRAAAAGKKIILRPGTMAGSAFFDGNTPNWVFAAIQNAPGGDRTIVTDCVTNSTKVVTSATADFTAHDLHSPVVGSDIPGAPTYIGTIVNATTIWLSSSPTSQVDVNATGSHSGLTLVFSAREAVNPETHSVVWGHTYDYLDANPNHTGDPETTIPVFWDPTFLAKHKKMLNALGDHITNGTSLTPSEKEAVSVIAIAYANAQTQDWNVPHAVALDGTNTINQVQRWLNSPTDPNPDLRGAGYTTQKMIDAAVRRVNLDQFTDGQTYTSRRLTSATALFTFADIGHEVRGPGIVTNSLIAEWVSPTEVQLDKDTTATASGVHFEIRSRDTGLYDIAVAAFPGKYVTSAIATSGPNLDKTASDAAGYTDPASYLAFAVTTAVNAKYPGRIVSQINSITAKTVAAPGTSNKLWNLLYNIRAGGSYVAVQDLHAVFGDPDYRMNLGEPGDYETISNNVSLVAFGYGATYREMYQPDVVGIPGAVKFCHDLLNGPLIPPPEPGPSGAKLQPFLTIEAVNFRDEIIFAICDLLNISTQKGLAGISRDTLDSIARGVNKHVKYAWRLFGWPEFQVLEERPFARVWNRIDDPLVQGELIFDLGTTDPVNGHTGQGYFILSGANGVFVEQPYALKPSDLFIPLLQTCRRRIGDMTAIYPDDPRPAGVNGIKMTLDWTLSHRGVEVSGYGANQTVFISYRAVPYKYSAELFDPTLSYKAGQTVIDVDGLVHRAIVDVQGGLPLDSDRYAPVPFPSSLSQYVIYMTAADMCGDMTVANGYKGVALEYLAREMDAKGDQLAVNRYDYSRRQRVIMPDGVSGFLWSAVPPYAATVAGSETTISDVCLSEWGDVMPS